MAEIKQESLPPDYKLSQILDQESDSGVALIGATILDNRLEELIKLNFLNNTISKDLLNNYLKDFSSRIKIAYALGLITVEEKRECEVIRKIRNKMAHSLYSHFRENNISVLCNGLQTNCDFGSINDRKSRSFFIHSVILLNAVFFNRLKYAIEKKQVVCKDRHNLTSEVNLFLEEQRRRSLRGK